MAARACRIDAEPAAGVSVHGPGWGWFTGWFNLLGLVAILASVDYFCGQFLRTVLGLYNVDIFGINFADANAQHALSQTFLLFAILVSVYVLERQTVLFPPLHWPEGSTAQCRDGTFSEARHRSGTCSGHHGVAFWRYDN